jgi:hypothetical protein
MWRRSAAGPALYRLSAYQELYPPARSAALAGYAAAATWHGRNLSSGDLARDDEEQGNEMTAAIAWIE